MKLRLSDVVQSANTGADAIKRAPIVDYDTGLRCLRIGDVSQKRKYKDWGFTVVTEEDYSRFKLEIDDIIVARTGNTIGVNCIITEEINSVFNNGLIRIKADLNKVLPLYLYYLIGSEGCQQYVQSIAFGTSTQPNMKIKDFLKYEFEYIPISEQEKIISILYPLDRKNELNKRINENLEQQARAIYQSFLDEHQTSFVTVEDLALTANTGADAIRKAPIVEYDTGIRCVRVGDMSNQRQFHEWGFTKVTPEIFKQYQLHKDDIVVTRTASLGLNRLIGEDLNAVYNNGLIRLSINKGVAFPLVIYRQFQTDDFRNYISRISGETSVRPNMKINYLMKYRFELPSISDQSELVQLIQPLFEKQERYIFENHILTSLRDALLPQLMSGQLDVSDLDL